MHGAFVDLPLPGTASGMSLLPLNNQKAKLRQESCAFWLFRNVAVILPFFLVGLPRLPAGFLSERFLPWQPGNFWVGTLLVIAGLGLLYQLDQEHAMR